MDKSETEIFYCEQDSTGTCAKGFPENGFPATRGFTVLAGSIISDCVSDSLDNPESWNNYGELREELINDGIIEGRVFQRDYTFTAPSAASSVVLGYSSNGKISWKTKDGSTLKDYFSVGI